MSKYLKFSGHWSTRLCFVQATERWNSDCPWVRYCARSVLASSVLATPAMVCPPIDSKSRKKGTALPSPDLKWSRDSRRIVALYLSNWEVFKTFLSRQCAWGIFGDCRVLSDGKMLQMQTRFNTPFTGARERVFGVKKQKEQNFVHFL